MPRCHLGWLIHLLGHACSMMTRPGRKSGEAHFYRALVSHHQGIFERHLGAPKIYI